MTINQKINAFVTLGKFFAQFENDYTNDNSIKELNKKFQLPFNELIKKLNIFNPWFTEEFIRKAIHSISLNLTKNKLTTWLNKYPALSNNFIEPLNTIGVIAAGNIPLVAFHDFLSVLISGNVFLGKLSSKDDKLLPFFKDILVEIDKEFNSRIYFTDANLKDFKAIIATGSNNSARYFNYYFGKYPNIIRKNRNGIAILDGAENEEDLRCFGNDIFTYFGLGCRNVSKIYVPVNYDFNNIFQAVEPFNYLYNHNKYANNVDYNRSVYLLNRIKIFDNGFLLLKEDMNISSPIGVLFFEYYDDLEKVKVNLLKNKDKIQCVVTNSYKIEGSVPFGKTQSPELFDYADNIDTIEFLIGL